METQLQNEMKTAREKYGTFNSTHEIYGVLQEEVDEFWDLVKKKTPSELHQHWRTGEMIKELRQVAAVALRAAQELENNEVKHI